MPFVVIDEIQKLPALLDEVHWLHGNRGVCFALCGSSARKVRRGHADLLGGRAIRYELRGLTSCDLGSEWELDRMINHGYLPRMYLSAQPKRLLRACCACTEIDAELSYWRLTTGTEVDFVVQDGRETWAIEVKHGRDVTDRNMRGFEALAAHTPKIKHRIVVCLCPCRMKVADAEAIPLREFLDELPA